MDSSQDVSHSPSVKACNSTFSYHVHLYGYVIWAGSFCCVFVQLGTKSGNNLSQVCCYAKTNGHRFCNVLWSNLTIWGIGGSIKGVRQSYQKRKGQKWVKIDGMA